MPATKENIPFQACQKLKLYSINYTYVKFTTEKKVSICCLQAIPTSIDLSNISPLKGHCHWVRIRADTRRLLYSCFRKHALCPALQDV